MKKQVSSPFIVVVVEPRGIEPREGWRGRVAYISIQKSATSTGTIYNMEYSEDLWEAILADISEVGLVSVVNDLSVMMASISS